VALAARGAKVIINYAARADAAQETASLVQSAGGQAALCGFDVADAKAVTDAVAQVAKEHGQLDILVNNAGVAINGLVMRFKESDWARIRAVNLDGAFFCTQAATRHLLRAKQAGRVVFVSSVVGEMGNAGQAAYAATKAGLLGMTRALAREFASRRVTVNAVAPGFIATDMTDQHMTEEARAQLAGQIPLGRIGGPEEVADAVAFLAGPEAAYITGQVIRVNGGMLM
jgi:3-oxoacyl-[acyl-carrier protein] reductase